MKSFHQKRIFNCLFVIKDEFAHFCMFSGTTMTALPAEFWITSRMREDKKETWSQSRCVWRVGWLNFQALFALSPSPSYTALDSITFTIRIVLSWISSFLWPTWWMMKRQKESLPKKIGIKDWGTCSEDTNHQARREMGLFRFIM